MYLLVAAVTGVVAPEGVLRRPLWAPIISGEDEVKVWKGILPVQAYELQEHLSLSCLVMLKRTHYMDNVFDDLQDSTE